MNGHLQRVLEPKLTGLSVLTVALSRHMGPHMTARAVAILTVVKDNKGQVGVKKLAEVIGVDKPVITRALNSLADLGYLTRFRNVPDDRRLVDIQLTDKGRKWLTEYRRLIRESPC